MRHGLRGLLGIAAAATTIAVGVPGVADAANTWTVQSVPLPSGATTTDLTGVSCTSATNCEAVMNWNQSSPGAEHWNGSGWTVQDFPANAFVYPTSVSCSSAANCMAAGFFEGTGYVQAYAESWNGSSWAFSPVIGYTGSQMYGVSCPSATHCMAVGYVSTSGTDEPLAEKWNGTVWKDVPVPAPSGENDGTLTSVSCVSAADCLAVGWTGLSGAPQMLAYTWNGTS